MNIALNPNINYNPIFRASEHKRLFSENIRERTDEKWMGASEMHKGILKGGLSAIFIGGFIALCDMLVSGTAKVICGNINFKDIINPLKSMSKYGKIITVSVAAYIFAKNIITSKIITIEEGRRG